MRLFTASGGKCEAEGLLGGIAQRRRFTQDVYLAVLEQEGPHGLCEPDYHCSLGGSMGDIPHLGVGSSYFSMRFFQSRAGLWEVLHVGVVNCDCKVSISCHDSRSETQEVQQRLHLSIERSEQHLQVGLYVQAAPQ